MSQRIEYQSDIEKTRASLSKDFLLAHHCIEARYKQLTNQVGWGNLITAVNSFLDARTSSTFDWRQNSYGWARDIFYSLRVSLHSVASTLGYADALKELSFPGNDQFLVTYYLRDSAINLFSGRDKIACLVWSHYFPIDPDDSAHLPSFEKVYNWISQPKVPKHRHQFWNSSRQTLQSTKPFVEALKPLAEKQFQEQITKLRHVAVHRREPRIYLKQKVHRDEFSAVLPVITKTHEDELERDLADLYPDPSFRKIVKDTLHIDGKRFRQVELMNHRFLFSDLAPTIEMLLQRQVTSTIDCLRILRRRAPFRRQ